VGNKQTEGREERKDDGLSLGELCGLLFVKFAPIGACSAVEILIAALPR
jgi:hypothetical protein